MAKEIVKIRERVRESGLTALFLSYYYKGKRKEESLRLYLVPELTADDRKKNKKTRVIAEQVRARRQTEMTDKIFKLGQHGKGKTLFSLFDEQTEERENAHTKGVWERARKKLTIYTRGNDLLLSDVDESFISGFLKFLKKGNHANSATLYYQKLKAVLNYAFKHRMISENPCDYVDGIATIQPQREFLTVEELKRLIETDNYNQAVRQCFLFSCLTGLRLSDVQNLKWRDVSVYGEFTRITFRQQKTQELLYQDINAQAANLLGESKGGDTLVFPTMPKGNNINRELAIWCKAAGIDKHITFHCARHTFATMMLSVGNDLYTVSKLLGHADVKTTQIYAKVLDRNRQDAIKKIPDLHI